MNTRTIMTPATNAMDSLRHELDRLYDRVTTPSLASSWPSRIFDSMRSNPAVNLLEDDDNLYFEAELPGVVGADLDIRASDRTITVSGCRTVETADDATTLRHERSTLRFERTMRLPVDVESDAIDARLESGVLTITLPKIKPARSRRVAVRNA